MSRSPAGPRQAGLLSRAGARLALMPRAAPVRAQHRAARGERFTAVMAACVRRLPFGLAGIVAPSLLGFAVINLFTFSVDLLRRMPGPR
jgi:hypothetical protein